MSKSTNTLQARGYATKRWDQEEERKKGNVWNEYCISIKGD